MNPPVLFELPKLTAREVRSIVLKKQKPSCDFANAYKNTHLKLEYPWKQRKLSGWTS